MKELKRIMKRNKLNRRKFDEKSDHDDEIQCPFFCETMLNLNTLTDHKIQCMKNMEACGTCGSELANTNTHWDMKIHSNVLERYACAKCMKSSKKRIKLILQHRNPNT